MTTPTPEERAQWREDAANIHNYQPRILALLDALEAEGNAYAVNYEDVVGRWAADHRERMAIERELTARAERAEQERDDLARLLDEAIDREKRAEAERDQWRRVAETWAQRYDDEIPMEEMPWNGGQSLSRAQRAEAVLARVEALADEDARSRAECAADPDCSCAYKDCYECGQWHNCIHTPWTAVRAALIGGDA